MAYTDFGPHNPIRVYDVDAVDLASIAAATSVEVDFTCTGVTTSDVVIAANKPGLEAGLVVGSARVSAADTVKVQIANVTAGAIDDASEDNWQIVVLKA